MLLMKCIRILDILRKTEAFVRKIPEIAVVIPCILLRRRQKIYIINVGTKL